jgi:hypothetical protein
MMERIHLLSDTNQRSLNSFSLLNKLLLFASEKVSNVAKGRKENKATADFVMITKGYVSYGRKGKYCVSYVKNVSTFCS